MATRAIIGRIPGYNENIDATGEFAEDLKKGITYIDLYPTAYVDALIVGGSSTGSDSSTLFGESLNELFKNPGMVMSNPPGKATAQTANTGQDPSAVMFSGVLARMQRAFGIDKSFADAKALRIVAANDSTFTEVFSNSFDAENMAVTGFNFVKDTINKIPFAGSLTKGAKTFDSMALQNLVGGAYGNIADFTGGRDQLAGLLTGAAVGMNIAAPQIWSASQYNSTLTLFVKLVSPTGQDDCIRKNILEPLLYLIAAASPITAYGTVYGYPTLWQVHAHGITNFRIGAIAALSIMRGSFETTFTKALQPTIIDVRLTIIPLLSDFAVQTDATNAPSIYEKGQENYLGVQNPADIHRGTMNTGPVGGQKQEDINIVSVKI